MADEPVSWLCGAFGPKPFPEAMPYRCSLLEGHEGAHEAWVDDDFRDSWAGAAEPVL